MELSAPAGSEQEEKAKSGENEAPYPTITHAVSERPDSHDM